jgi:hypothetical protein
MVIFSSYVSLPEGNFPVAFPMAPTSVFSTPTSQVDPSRPADPENRTLLAPAGAQRPQLVRWTGRSLQLRGPAALMWLGHGGEGGFTMMISPAKSGNFSHEHVWMCSEFTE